MIDPNTGLFKEPSKYTKDGKMIEEKAHTGRPIENSIICEIQELTNYMVKMVGDGTTTIIEMAYNIMKNFAKLELVSNVPSYKITNTFALAAKNISEIIRKRARTVDLETIRNIATISTNNNEAMIEDICKIYEEHGLDVEVTFGMSNSETSWYKVYDGISIETGMCDPVFINVMPDDQGDTSNAKSNKNYGRCVIKNPNIYVFGDPINDYESCELFRHIINKNIIDPITNIWDKYKSRNIEAPDFALKAVKPTVIIAPDISRDTASQMKQYINFMHRFQQNLNEKPPLLIITGLTIDDMTSHEDIWDLCGAKLISKYINPQYEEKDKKLGLAPTKENIDTFAGTCGEVQSDSLRSIFKEPSQMYVEGTNPAEKQYSDIYYSRIQYFEEQVRQYTEQGDSAKAGILKNRLHAYKGNMVQYMIGGISTLDRSSKLSAAEDAIFNIKSACKSGYGYGASYEGYTAAKEVLSDCGENDESLYATIVNIIADSYYDVILDLYKTSGLSDEDAGKIVEESLTKKMPFNLVTEQYDGKVLTSIDTDPVILEGISKIITIMMSTNQAILPNYALNTYGAPLKDQKIDINAQLSESDIGFLSSME